MNFRRIAFWAFWAFVAWWVISNPTAAGTFLANAWHFVAHAAHSLATALTTAANSIH
jgi:hypothetical protein